MRVRNYAPSVWEEGVACPLCALGQDGQLKRLGGLAWLALS